MAHSILQPESMMHQKSYKLTPPKTSGDKSNHGHDKFNIRPKLYEVTRDRNQKQEEGELRH